MKQLRISKQKGLSLVELLVALALSAALMAGIIEVYLENKRNYVQNEEYARLQENGRYALGLLKREVKMAGFFGGLPDVSDISATSVVTDCVGTGNWALDVSASIEIANDVSSGVAAQTIRGSSSASSATLTCISPSELQAGSDLLVIRRTADTATLEDGVFNIAESADKQRYLRIGEYGADKDWAFLASEDIPGADQTSGSEVDYWRYYTNIFYLRSYSASVGDGIPTLCIERLQNDAFGGADCLVEGVEDFQVEVGIDTDDDGYVNQFVAAPTSTQLESAVAVRLHVLVRSINDLQGYTNNKTYLLGSKSITSNDAFLRQVYSSTVQLRNSQLGI
jgi:prepilin-type N-terminal cleavage/methylation domain-containing protein